MTTSDDQRRESDSGDTFDAFISYSHADRKKATRLQAFLQSYKLPTPGHLLRVYLDQTDIRSGDLSNELDTALRRSKALVVCCSPASTESKWVSRELALFSEEGTRPIVPIVLDGDPVQVVPSVLRRRESRHLDLRGRWWWIWLAPVGRVELARGIAAIIQCPLRRLVDWEKRRQRRSWVGAGFAFLCVSIGILIYPLNYLRELTVRDAIGPLRTLEFSEVRDDRVIATAREVSVGPQGGRDYVAHYPNVLAGGTWNWLMPDTFSPRTRLVELGSLDADSRKILAERSGEGIHNAVSQIAAQRERELEAAGGGLEADFAPRGPWLGEPSPGRFVILYVVPPLPIDPADLLDGYVTPPAGDAIAAVIAPGQEPTIAMVEGFDPQTQRAPSPRSLNLRRQVPIAVCGEDLWLGMAVREDGRTGGLWHSPNGGRTWSRLSGFASVESIAIDENDRQRVLVAMGPGRMARG